MLSGWMSPTLAWVPILEPLNFFHLWWYTLAIPMSFGIAMVYKALRLPTLDRYWFQVLVMTVQVLAGMAALGGGLWLLVRLVIPLLPAE